MQSNKNKQYPFDVEEQQIFEILATFEKELEEKLQKSNSELELVKYYDDFEIKGMKNYELSGVFLTHEKDAEGKISYHLYCRSASEEILSVDNNGNIQINSKWREVVGNINFEKSMKINDDEKQKRVKGISKKVSSEEIKKKPDSQKKDKESEEEQIEQDLDQQNDLKIGYYRKIKDKSFGEQIGQDLSKYEEVGLAYSNTKNSFILIGKNNGTFERVEGFKDAQITYKKVMDIGNGEVEEQVPHALMETDKEDKELSITIGQYGYIDVATVDRLPCDARVQRRLQEQGETEKDRTDPLLNESIRNNGKEGLEELAHQNEYIPNTNITWEKFAEKCGYRGEGAIEEAQKVFYTEKTKPENYDRDNGELIKEIINDIEEQVPGRNIKKG